MSKNTNQQPPPQLTADSLLDALIGLAMRKHSNQCVFTMDSRLACSCGAELHNAKVQGVAIRLQGALAQPAPAASTNAAPQPNPRTIKLDDLPPADPNSAPAPEDSIPDPGEAAPPKFETGTSSPPIGIPLPTAPVQPHVPSAPAAPAANKPTAKKAGR